ncbi:MAG: DUF4426 domain-containing protein [Marinicellaceae bacterium]
MKKTIRINTVFFLVLIAFNALSSDTDNTKIEKGYEVHYNALSTSFLTPEVSKNYQIGRSKTKGFVNIAVLKQIEGEVSMPVEAQISIKANNIYGQNKKITLRKISENDGAIYYIGVFPVSSREIINFKAQVVPENSKVAIDIKFDQEFYTD